MNNATLTTAKVIRSGVDRDFARIDGPDPVLEFYTSDGSKVTAPVGGLAKSALREADDVVAILYDPKTLDAVRVKSFKGLWGESALALAIAAFLLTIGINKPATHRKTAF